MKLDELTIKTDEFAKQLSQGKDWQVTAYRIYPEKTVAGGTIPAMVIIHVSVGTAHLNMGFLADNAEPELHMEIGGETWEEMRREAMRRIEAANPHYAETNPALDTVTA